MPKGQQIGFYQEGARKPGACKQQEMSFQGLCCIGLLTLAESSNHVAQEVVDAAAKSAHTFQ